MRYIVTKDKYLREMTHDFYLTLCKKSKRYEVDDLNRDRDIYQRRWLAIERIS
jgi:hypothetical protein